MNYIELINNFWKIDHDFKFSSLETALYFRLLSKANSTCWQEEFVYTNARLMEELDCSVSKLRHARDRLLKAGLFTYVSGNKSTPGKYSLLSQHNRNTAATESRQNHDTKADNTKSLSLEDLREDRPTVLATIAAQSQHNDDTIEAQKQQIIINKTKPNKTKQINRELPIGNSSVKLTDASSELADFDRSLKNEREVSSEGKAEESQKSGSTVKTSPSKAKPSNSIDEFFDGLLSGKSMNEMLFDSPPEDEATYIPPNDSQLFSPSHTPFENIRLAFVECCPSLPAPKEAKAWTEKRKRTVKSRWKKNPSMDFWYGFFHKIEDSDFLSGRKTDWRASFDWIMKPANFEKISEGCYDNAPDQMAQVLDRVMRREW